MKYVNTYTSTEDFNADKSRLNTLDDTWAAFVEEEEKTYIKTDK